MGTQLNLMMDETFAGIGHDTPHHSPKSYANELSFLVGKEISSVKSGDIEL